ncbi:relB antitoxin family protein [Acinetobacter sp. 479375]|nr:MULTISPECIES: type II toxin-antitoxin system RelB/DinJ family antitoxin [Acinetobacter]EXD37632.1 relB antitoxin family protein [Acinetobacter sp. 479375]MCH2015704.1 type II toxin-antitoxin system RelB/DinJ family antitoxin [Acinetobacter ursingii]
MQVGLRSSEAIRLLLTHVVNPEQFPRELKIPNLITIAAMNADPEPATYHSAKALFADLGDESDD